MGLQDTNIIVHKVSKTRQTGPPATHVDVRLMDYRTELGTFCISQMQTPTLQG